MLGLEIVWFDFIFVKPRDVPLMFCFSVRTVTKLSYNAYPVERRTVEMKCRVNLHIKAKHRRHIVWFHKHNIEPKYV